MCFPYRFKRDFYNTICRVIAFPSFPAIKVVKLIRTFYDTTGCFLCLVHKNKKLKFTKM